MRRVLLFALALAALLVLPANAIARQSTLRAQPNEYVVLYAHGAPLASARLAVQQAGGLIVRENRDIGVATVTSLDPAFVGRVAEEPALAGAAHNRPIGKDAPLRRASKNAIERLTAAERALARKAPAARRPLKHAPDADPFAPLQWDMAMIHATVDGSYSTQRGDRKVLVGIIDTGIDGSHPDIRPNFDRKLSRNFTTDIPDPDVDGPCEHPSCVDPPDEDDDGHGTHVAGIVAGALNGIGTAGVAPDVTLVNVRAGQDSGFFFLQPTVDALTYAADHGIDVVNMSFFTDPWLYNCSNNPADSPQAQAEQRTVIAATNRALDYAHAHNVTLISALGNENTDLGNPTSDDTSPDFPLNTAYHRDVDNSCQTMPTEGHHVIGVSAVGPSTFKADYSNWGEHNDVAAPGGYFRDFAGTPQNRVPGNLVLSAEPLNVAQALGDIDANGDPTSPFVLKSCKGKKCAYYQYLQGTSMASPHAVGVAALIVSTFGRKDHGGLTMNPDAVARILERTATDHPCPDPPVLDYTIPGRDRDASFNATCVGTAAKNSIWGDGIVDALAASRR